MRFAQRHPYLFWQLIGWGLMAADFGFLVISALNDFGEWCYPIIVFTFIGALFAIAASPVIIRFMRRREVPQNSDEFLEKAIRAKIGELRRARYGAGSEVIAAILAFSSIFVFMFAAYILGDRVHLALGFASMVLALITPFLIIGAYSATVTKKFFTVKNGEKLIDFVTPPDIKQLGNEDPPTFVIRGEPDTVLLNFFRNWLQPYMREDRLTMYRITAPELCKNYRPSSVLEYGDILLCIPTEQLYLTKENEARFRTECDIMNAIRFSFLAAPADQADTPEAADDPT